MPVDGTLVAHLVDSGSDHPAGIAPFLASRARLLHVRSAAQNLPAGDEAKHTLQSRKAYALLVKEEPNGAYPIEVLIRIETACVPSRRDDHSLILVDS